MNSYSKRIPQILSRLGATKFFILTLIAVSACFTSCDKPTFLGKDVLPESDLLNVGYQDTTTIVTTTVKEDSLRTDQGVIADGTALIGKYLDPTFGMTSASLYTQLRLPTSNPNFGEQPQIDAVNGVQLSLVMDPNFYGDTTAPQNFNVYQLKNDLVIGKSYYSKDSVDHYSFDLANNQQDTLHPLTKSIVAGQTIKPHLTINIDPNFGQAILNNQGGAALVSNEAFQTFTKGLYITAEHTQTLSPTNIGAIAYFKMADPQTKLTINYHAWVVVRGVSVYAALKYDFPLSSVVRFSRFNHYDYASACTDLYNQIHGTTNGDSITYIQALSGVKTKIAMPFIKNWQDKGPMSINKAELVVKVDSSLIYDIHTFPVPPGLIVFGIRDDGTSFGIADTYEGSTYFGGSYTTDGQYYHFNIARYIQQVLNGDLKNNGLYLLTTGGAIKGNRVVIGGGKNRSTAPTHQMKLNITYTKIK